MHAMRILITNRGPEISKLPELMPEELRTAGYSLRPLALKDSLHIEFYV
jgi:hypothetical protein